MQIGNLFLKKRIFNFLKKFETIQTIKIYFIFFLEKHKLNQKIKYLVFDEFVVWQVGAEPRENVASKNKLFDQVVESDLLKITIKHKIK